MKEKPIVEAVDLVKDFRLTLHRSSLKALILSGGWVKRETVHALQGFSLSVRAGEAVALVGRNGSGKSTFLSLVGRIYLPTSGALHVRGRVAPLLQLGAGFHHDLTGRENVEMNAMILGMSRGQIAERMDAIVDFAELRPFIDAPLQTYSSGMQMRLGFAVAAFSDAEILIVDEALAVGDEEFQEKCFARIEEFKTDGRTLLFVSHEMTDVLRVATRAVWVEQGRVRMDGDPHEVVDRYLAHAHHADE
jgi:lipopolysaccharide transport system ATP-binding protein